MLQPPYMSHSSRANKLGVLCHFLSQTSQVSRGWQTQPHLVGPLDQPLPCSKSSVTGTASTLHISSFLLFTCIMPACEHRDGSLWLSLLLSWCNSVYKGRRPGEGEKGQAGAERREESGNEQITIICTANTRLEILRARTITKRSYLFYVLKGSETKHLPAPGFVL